MRNWLEITSVIPCTLQCPYCPQKKITESYSSKSSVGMMTFDNYKKYLSSVPSDLLISFSGFAEPFLSKDILKIMKWTADRGHPINLSTTFVGANSKMLPELKEIPFEEITVHLPWKFLAKPESMPDAYLSLISEAGEFHKDKELKFVHFELLPVTVVGAIKKYTIVEGQLIDRAGNLDDTGNHKYKQGRLSCSECGNNYNNNVLLPDGRVVLCCMDYSLKHIIGDLSKMSYAELFNSKNYVKIKRGSIDETAPLLCRNCNKAVIDEEYKYPFYLKLKYKFYKKFRSLD